MEKFKPGEVVYHKATHKRCVVKEYDGKEILVTTQDDEFKRYYPEELWSEEEWLEKIRVKNTSNGN